MELALAGIIGGLITLGIRELLFGDLRQRQTATLRDQVAIAVVLKEKGLTPDEVQNIIATISTRRRIKAVPAPTVARLAGLSPYWTQSEMNKRAANASSIADLEMRAVLQELEPFLTELEAGALINAQSAWESYRTKEAEFAASEFDGGTLAPLIASATVEELTRSRTASLKENIKRRNALYETEFTYGQQAQEPPEGRRLGWSRGRLRAVFDRLKRQRD